MKARNQRPQDTLMLTEARLLLAHVLGKEPSFILSHPEYPVDKKREREYLTLVKKRLAHEPMAYLIGTQPFYGRNFKVNRHTLIPRPETEFLCEKIKTESKGRIMFVEFGTGSGCIAITLSLETGSRVIASDVSEAAVRLARINSKNLKADIDFVRDNLFGPRISKRIAVVMKSYKPQRLVFVANLPYLPVSDRKTMMPDVKDFEPAQALFVKGDGTGLMAKLLDQISRKDYAVPISIYLEMDPRQGKKMRTLAKRLFPHHVCALLDDQFGRTRFLKIHE